MNGNNRLDHFCNALRVIKNDENKGMITTDMLKRQVWMADDDEFEYIAENSQKVLRLSDQNGNHMLKNLQKSVMLCLYMEYTF